MTSPEDGTHLLRTSSTSSDPNARARAIGTALAAKFPSI